MAGHAKDGEFGFQIAPMLDVLFVLLLFFMVSAGMQKHEGAITTPLPGTGKVLTVPINLDIASDGQVSFNGVPTDTPANHELSQTEARLKAVLADAPDRPVIIRPAPDVRQQRVVDVLNACVAVRARNMAFGTWNE